MTYQPLHHKYRPQTFAQLVGQDAIATTLSNALKQNRIAPAYLFTGARGTGKTSSARIFAKSLNCMKVNAPTDHPCGECETCRSITNGSALDVIEIDAASNTGVDNIRELIERAQFAPVQCRYKVYVIDEVHMLSNAAFNALLKTLEEPPNQVVFIIATTDPQRVLPTIISRCQRFDFRRIPLDAMVEHLGTIAHKEQISIANEALHLIAQISQGGLRDAESLLDQLSLLAGDITVERVWDLVGAVPERDLMALIEAIATDDPEAVLDTTRRLMDRGREPLIVLQNLASFYRDLLIAKTSPTRGDLVALTPPTWNQLCEFANQWTVSTILSGQQRLKDSETQLKNTTQPRLWLEVTLMGLLPSAIQPASEKPLQFVQSTTPTDLRRAEAIRAKRNTDETAKPASKPAIQLPQPSETAEPTSDETPEPEIFDSPLQDQTTDPPDLEQLWQKVIHNLQPFGTQALLKQQGSLISFDGETAQIGIASDKLLGMAQGRSANIKAAFQKTFGKEIKFSMIVAPSNSTSVLSSPEAPTQNPSESVVDRDPQPAPPEDLSPDEPALEDPHPENPPYVPQDWQDDEVTRAALNLAEAFNGSVVDLEPSIEESPPFSIEDPIHDVLPEELDDDDEDIEF